MAQNSSAQEQLKSAAQFFRAGKHAQAETIYREILANHPTNADALLMLGVIALQTSRTTDGTEFLKRAAEARPNWADAWNNYGYALQQQGRITEAAEAYRRALAIQPTNPAIIANLGAVVFGMGKIDEARELFESALRIKPDYADAHNGLGNVLAKEEKREEAMACYKRVLELRPNDFFAMNNLATIYNDLKRYTEAMTTAERGLAINPKYAPLHLTRGNILLARKKWDDAIAGYRKALELKPDFPEVHFNMGNALAGKDENTAAIDAFRRTLELNPEHRKAMNNLAINLKDTGQIAESLAVFRRFIAMDPKMHEPWSNYFLTKFYDPGLDPAMMMQELAEWNANVCAGLSKNRKQPAQPRDPAKRIRIGYVSADFRNHVVMYFMLPVLRSHDRTAFEIFCYADVAQPDHVTDQVKATGVQWRDINEVKDDQVAEMIQRDGIDILVDLAGHTGGNRLPVFARKPAPIQVTYAGYAGSTGLLEMDYRLTDNIADPEGMTERWHTEKLFQFAPCFLCYTAPLDAPSVAPLPAQATGQVTFGCFNALPKINEPLVKLWARILQGVPGSRLRVKNRGLGDSGTRSRVAGWFKAAGIDQSRVELAGYTSGNKDHLGAYNQIDVALDTFPYHGTTTTCEALWMGVPVVTLAGQTHLSRVGASLLGAVGLSEWVGESADEYVSKAVQLAKDLPRLGAMRANLREQMKRSPLMDGVTFTRRMEAAYREMRRLVCEHS